MILSIFCLVEINLSPSKVIYSTTGGFDITFDGNKYLNNNLIIEISTITERMNLDNTPVDITVKGKDQDIIDAIETSTYINRKVVMYICEYDSDGEGSIISTKLIKQGVITAYSRFADGEKIKLTVGTRTGLLGNKRNDQTSSGLQKAKILSGLYGTAPSFGVSTLSEVVDRCFDGASNSFEDVRLGDIKEHQVMILGRRRGARRWFGLKKGKWLPAVYETREARQGIDIRGDGDNFALPLTFGSSYVEPNLIQSWNIKRADIERVTARDWASSPANVDEDTEFITLVYALCVGEVEKLIVSLDVNYEQADGGKEDTKYFEFPMDHSTNTIKQVFVLNDEQQPVAMITTQAGTRTQRPPQNIVDLSDGAWTADHRGIGVCIAYITLMTYDWWTSSLPEMGFNIVARKIRGYDGSGTSDNKTANLLSDFLTSKVYGAGFAYEQPDIDVPSFRALEGSREVSKYLNGSIEGSSSYTEIVMAIERNAGIRVYEEEGIVKLFYSKPKTTSDIVQRLTGTDITMIKEPPIKSSSALNSARAGVKTKISQQGSKTEVLNHTYFYTSPAFLLNDSNVETYDDIDLDLLTGESEYIPDSFSGKPEDAILKKGVGFSSDDDWDRISKAHVLKSRYQTMLELGVTYNKGKSLKLGDLIQIGSDVYSWTLNNERLYIIVGIRTSLKNYKLILSCQRYQSKVFDLAETQRINSHSDLPVVKRSYTNNIPSRPLTPPTVVDFVVSLFKGSLEFRYASGNVDGYYTYTIKEIALETSSWDSGSIVGSDIASNKYTHPFPRKGLTWYGIKAYNSVGVPSAVMATTSISLSVNDRINIFQTTHIDFSEGTITGAGRISAYNEALGYTSRAFEISPANKWDQDNWDDNGEAWDKPVEEAIAVYTSKIYDNGKLFEGRYNTISKLENIGLEGLTTEISTGDTIAGMSAFRPFSRGDYKCRFWSLRITIKSDGLKKARILSLQVDIDFEDKDASGLKIEIPATGKIIDLEGFLAVKELQVTCLEGLPVTVDQTDLPDSFKVINNNGTLVHINYSIRGY